MGRLTQLEVWDDAEAHGASLELAAVRELIARARPTLAGIGKRFELQPLGGKGSPARHRVSQRVSGGGPDQPLRGAVEGARRWALNTKSRPFVLGGNEFGEDTGYRKPRLLSPEDVVTAADAIAGVSVDAFRGRIDFERLAQLDVYPSIWDRTEEHSELLDYVSGGFETVRTVILEAATENDGIVVVCT